MGLDMYLSCNSKKLAEKVHESEPYGEYITPFYMKDGIILYWRKANAIHSWFVRNIQADIDDCRIYEVGVDDLVMLHDACKKVLDSTRLVDGMVRNGRVYKDGEWHDNMVDGKVLEDTAVAEEVMPTQDRFFFGETAYDEWYWNDLERTVRELGRILDMVKPDEEKSYMTVLDGEPDWYVKFYYQASW